MTNKEIKLNAESRTETNGKGKQLRRNGYIPAVIYGPDTESTKVKIPYNEFERVFHEAGESTLIDLSINGEKSEKVLVKDYQTDPVKEGFLHVDLYKVRMGEEMTTEVPLNFVNDSRLVKEEGALLVKNIETVEITCLPKDLPNQIDVDLSTIDSFDDQIKLSDLELPKGVELTSETDDTVVSAVHPKQESADEEEPEAEAEEEGEEEGEEQSE